MYIYRSKTGFVNVYGSNAFESSLTASNPKPLKALGNLTTSVSCLRFNHDSQMLAIASHAKKDQMRLVCNYFSSVYFISHLILS